MRERQRIDAVLARYRTKPKPRPDPRPGAGDARAGEHRVTDPGEAGGSGAAEEEDGGTSAGYFPYKPYCSVCLRDLTTVTGYDDQTTALSYTCACGHDETVLLTAHRLGKLVWKVD